VLALSFGSLAADRLRDTTNAFEFSGVLLVVMAILKDRLDERIAETDKARRKSDQT